MVALHSSGKNMTQMKKMLECEGIKTSQSAVSLFHPRYQNTGSLRDAKSSGRKSKLQNKHVNFIDNATPMSALSKNCPTSDKVLNKSRIVVTNRSENIPVRITQRNNLVRKNVKVEHLVNLANIEINEYMHAVQPHFNKRPQTYDIPSILTTNVRAIGNKIDEIQLHGG